MKWEHFMTPRQNYDMSGREYVGINQVLGSLLVIENIHNVGYNTVVDITDREGGSRTGLAARRAP